MSADAAYEPGPARAGRVLLLLAALLGSSALLAPLPALAEVATDGTLGRRVRLTGRDVEVGADLGQVRGRNLFHSFQRFGVQSGGSVTFTGPGGLDNVISRVTGGEVSRIDGTLRSRVPGADVYLVNPSGVVFGPGARLNVPGSFHASTADEVRFPDGARFSALDPGGSTLSVAPPQAFGFLGGGRPGTIAIDRSVLAVPDGQSLSLVGGSVEIRGDPSSPDPTVAARGGGRLTVAAVASDGEVRVADGTSTVERFGRVSLTEGGALFTSGAGGGVIKVRAGRLDVEGAFIIASSTEAGAEVGGINIRADEVLISAGGQITTQATATGLGGSLKIRADRVELNQQSLVGTLTRGSGEGGALMLSVDRLSVGEDSEVTTRAAGTGPGGAAIIDAGSIQLTGRGRLGAVSEEASASGSVRVTAGSILASGMLSGIFSSGGTAGPVSIVADSLTLDGGAVVEASAFGSGGAGEVRVVAGEITIVGRAGGPPGTPGFGGRSRITARSGEASLRPAGTIVIWAESLVLDGGVVGTETVGISRSGEISVRAANIDIRRGGAITATTLGLGAAGDVTVTADRLRLRDGGEISSEGLLISPAGDVRVQAGLLSVEGGRITTQGVGAIGGRIAVSADEAIVFDGAEVTSNGIVPAAGASLITLRAPAIALLNASLVTSLTGNGQPLGGSGEARVLGELTFVADDSTVAASSTVELLGIDNEVGSDLQLPASVLLSAEDLLGTGCEARRISQTSSFTRLGKGGTPPSPERPLTSLGASRSRDRSASAALVPGPLLAACDPTDS